MNMTVKSATKKKLQDLGVQESYAHELADDRKWDDVVLLSPVEIAKICGTDSKSGEVIHNIIQNTYSEFLNTGSFFFYARANLA